MPPQERDGPRDEKQRTPIAQIDGAEWKKEASAIDEDAADDEGLSG